MRKVAASAVLASAFMALGVTQASADAPKFFSASSSVSNSGALLVSFEERGLGNEDVDYTITADATATYACVNKGGKNPEAANKRAEGGEVTGGGHVRAQERTCRRQRLGRPDRAGNVLLPGRTAPGAGGCELHQHRVDRHDERCEHRSSGRIADLRVRVSGRGGRP